MIKQPINDDALEIGQSDGRKLTKLWDWIDLVPMLSMFVFLFLALSVAALFLAGARFDLNGELTGTGDPFLLVLYSLGGTLLAMLIPYFGVNIVRKRHSLATLGLGSMPKGWFWPSVGLGIGAGVVRMGIGSGLLWLYPWLEEGAEELAEMFAFEQTWQLVIVGIAATFVVPVYEEIFFRGVIHNGSRGRVASWFITIACSAIFGAIVIRATSEVPSADFTGVAIEILLGLLYGAVAGAIVCAFIHFGLRNRAGMWLTILASSSVFGLFHGFPIQIITAFLMGLVLGWMYEKTNSLWPVIVTHVTNNGFAMGLAALSVMLGWE